MIVYMCVVVHVDLLVTWLLEQHASFMGDSTETVVDEQTTGPFVTVPTTLRPRKPRSPRPPPPPVPEEDQVVLNPAHFGHFLHPAGVPVLLQEEFPETPPAPPPSSSPSPAPPPASLSLPAASPAVLSPLSATPPLDPLALRVPVGGSSAEPPLPPPPTTLEAATPEAAAAAAAPSLAPAAELAGHAGFASEAHANGKKHLPRPPVSGQVRFGGEPAREGAGGPTGEASQDSSGKVADKNDSPERNGEQRAEAEPERSEDDIFIDDPFFGDEKLFNFAGELIAIGEEPVAPVAQERDKAIGEKEQASAYENAQDSPPADRTEEAKGHNDTYGQSETHAGIETHTTARGEEATPSSPFPNFGSMLHALNDIIDTGHVHVAGRASAARRDIRLNFEAGVQ
ncbi:hypothetical protein BESB_074900 [Besnoitia besnoiti]|uniref:Uncharacterized protein n=1 Tax=Besnoitia besnoiti TaxID=94643 RepID=A0A2A9M796_BESBE|nr:uncharacterized protein BESB_074900 [Besnoitia besnoiti]PFH34338.1 hypothetical protein BESB_074900 [Besnoitia besnoiti]